MNKQYSLVIRRKRGETTVKYYKTYDKALQGLMEHAKKELPLESILDYLRGSYVKTTKQKALLAPKYRGSVARFWSELFSGENFPPKQRIDYSDYVGDISDDEDELDEDELDECDLSYIERLWDELYFYASCDLEEAYLLTCGDYDKEIGFYFITCSRGALLQMFDFEKLPILWVTLGRAEDRYIFTFHFENYTGYSPIVLDFFILPPMPKLSPSKKATSLMVLDALFSNASMSPEEIVNYIESEYMHSFSSLTNGVPAICGSLSTRQVYRHIKALREFGYEIETTPKNRWHSCFYIKNLNSESVVEYPAPVKKDWNPTLYPIIILLTLQNCEKPLPVYSRNAQNDTLKKRILERYGVDIDRKAIERNIDVLILMGYSIRRDSYGVFMEKKELFPNIEREREFSYEYYDED